jgi:lipoprotein-anchoring transpeptidase ErfK/SrfK
MIKKERATKMSLMHRNFLLSLIVSTLMIPTACAPPSNNSNSAITQATPSPSASASQQSAPAAAQITLPLLDALLTDEAFQRELKTRLNLSDDQIASLKRASEAEIARLRESNAEETDGNGTDAPTRTAAQLTSLANEFWAKGDPAEAAPDKFEMLKGPNAVPTDTRVVVNIPAFRMDLFQNGSLVKSYKIGIGYPAFPLPLGMRKAQTVIFNPPWTPPDSPWVASMKNVTAGETVEPGSKDNPLGLIKIPIGSPSLIHGGKSPGKIGKFASHGCVGLTNAQVKDFATLLLQAASNEVSEREIASYLQDKTRTKSVKLNQVIPVELRYETIVLEDGKLYIYKDVYAQNTNTEENLRSVLEANGASLDDLSEEQRRQALEALNAMSAKPQATIKASPSPQADKNNAKKKAPQNEVVIEIGALAQKGYPAPVNLDEGKGKPQVTQTKKKST